MATWDDVDRICLALPEAEEGTSYGNRAWKVHGRAFAWERPLTGKDLTDLGRAAAPGPVLAVSVPDVGATHALIADDPAVFFTIPHLAGYAAVLVRLDAIDVGTLTEVAGEAWASRAPRRLVARLRP